MLDQVRLPADDQLTRWEHPLNGRLEDEHLLFKHMAIRAMAAQWRAKVRGGALELAHFPGAKPHLSMTGARIEVSEDLPSEFRFEHWRPGTGFDVAIRFASADPIAQLDRVAGSQSLSMRIDYSTGVQDFLFDDQPHQLARNAQEALGLLDASARPRWRGWAHLVHGVGLRAALRIGQVRRKESSESLAGRTYWTAGAMLWGDAGPVQLSLRPLSVAATAAPTHDPNFLRGDFAARLADGDLAWELCASRFVDESRTPVEDTSVAWRADAPVVLGRLVIPQREVVGIEAQNDAALVEAMAFNPWNTTETFRPLGSVNRARKQMIEATEAHRAGTRFYTNIPIRNRAVTAILMRIYDLHDRFRPLHELPTPLALMNLTIFRSRQRKVNLIDMDPPELVPSVQQPPPPIPEDMRVRRSFDGRMNDLSAPEMGKIGATFGRNMPPDPRPELLHTPDPHTISQELLFRKEFIPATSINILAAAWIQFQAHDWVQHSRYPLGRRDITVPMPPGKTWRNTPDGPEETEMRIAGDKPVDPTEPNPLSFPNRMSHWWDGTELYGPGEEHALSLLEGPKFRMEDGYLPRNVRDLEVTGFNESWWLGLSAMHTLFAREHNTVVDMLRSAHRDWNDMRLYHTARLIVSALIAKIHTVEWTPAILATDIIDKGLNANWGGLTDPLSKFGAWMADEHALTGILETLPDHHAAPYSLTEEFITVYRLHPLIPDDFYLRDAHNHRLLDHLKFDALQGRHTSKVMRATGLENTLYSLGTAHPGAVTLHNYPNALQAFTRETADGTQERIDLSVVDIMRERTRGIPRYNKFREGLQKPPIKRWEDINPDPENVRKLKEIYGTLDNVDTMVGLFAEEPPAGFGFSDTAFRIFLLMATRRIQSDRFLTVDFRPEIYSPEGIAWVEENTMTSVILRQYPDLAAVIPTDRSAFAPWRTRSGA